MIIAAHVLCPRYDCHERNKFYERSRLYSENTGRNDECDHTVC